MAVLRRYRSRQRNHAPLAIFQRIERQHPLGRHRGAPVGCHKVQLHDPVEFLRRVALDRAGLPVPRDDLARAAAAGTANEDALLPVRGTRFGKARFAALFVHHVDLAEHSADLLGRCLALLGIDI